MVVARSVVIGIAVAWLFDRAGVPAGALIGAMVAAAALNLGGVEIAIAPGWLRLAGFGIIGWVLGQEFTRDTLTSLREGVLPVLVVVGVLLAAGGLLTVILRAMGLDTATAFLAASPGGISQMAAISADVGANAPLVVTVHLIRIIAVVFTAPIVVRLLTR